MPEPKQPSAAPEAVTVPKAEYDALAARLAALEGRLNAIGPAAAPAEFKPDGSHDLATYSHGKLTHRKTGETFQFKHVPNDEHGKVFKLKNAKGFFEAQTLAELRDNFDGDLLAKLESSERDKAKKAQAPPKED